MGELSRTIGELGENITLENVLKKIGWRGKSNFDISCAFRKRHDVKKHGIDFFTVYTDPLVSDTSVSIIVSVKYNEVPPNKANFISYVEAVTTATECLRVNGEYTNAVKAHRNNKTRTACVIFWLNHTSNDERNILNKIGDSSSDTTSRFDTIYLVDNFRLSFLYKATIFAENLYPNSTFLFAYPPTGLNDGVDTSGHTLPVEFITSPVLPFRIITENNQKILLLCLHEDFSDSNLLRIMGLAEVLTQGWCNKVILAFPNYQPSQHEAVKHSVYMNFTNSFSDMVEVMSYNTSFKNLERKIKPDFYNYPDIAHINNNINAMLPFGDRMRQLLVQSYIYKNDLQTLLNKRGVFVEKQAGKNELVPLVSRMLLSPSEFDFLRKKQMTKESAEKISSQYLVVDENFSNADLIPLLESALGKNMIEEILISKYPNCHLSGSPTFEIDAQGDILINFQIIREDLSKDWTTASATFNGQVMIREAQLSAGNYQCRIDAISTSSETKTISKQIIEQFIKELQEKGFISKETQAKKLLASSLVNRSDFLWKFISKQEDISNEIFFYELLSFESKIFNNSKENFSEDVESLKNKVNISVFSGHALEDVIYVSNPKYRRVFDSYLMTCIFKVTAPYFQGTIQAEFGFPDLKNKSENKSEFELKILDISPIDGRILVAREYHEIEVQLREEFNTMKDYAYSTSEKMPHQTAFTF